MYNIVKTIPLFIKSMADCDYSYDIYFRMAVIEEYQKGNKKIWDLYQKMQQTRCNQNPVIPIYMINHKNEYCELIQSIEKEGYNYNYPILINKDYLIIDGAHRMACALYFNCPTISIIQEQKDIIPNEYTKEWFINNHLSECIPYAEHQKRLVRSRYHV